ncbi:unnamed protein product, partial [marine sediment metagenome]
MVSKSRVNTQKLHWADERYFKLLLYAFKEKAFDETEIPYFLKTLKRKYEISDEKLKFWGAIMNIREGYYDGAEINSF